MSKYPVEIDQLHGEELIRDRIGFDPSRPGEGEARLLAEAIPVWAIIGILKVGDWNVATAVEAYEITEEDVLAAIAYYDRHRHAIDARLGANELSPV